MNVKRKTRREALQLLGSTSASLLVGCGGRSEAIPGDAPAASGGTAGLGGGAGGRSGVGGASASGGGSQTGGFGGVAGSGGVPANACVVRPAQTEGPYFIDERLNRSDIRSDPSTGLVKDGRPLKLILHVHRITNNGCAPLPAAMVDLWQCDASGIYAGVVDAAGRFDTRGQQFLRGYQLSDADGAVSFDTVYPGWYPGRTVHLHFKVRTNFGMPGGYQFVSQLYFDQAMTDAILAEPPYDAQGLSSVPNESDGIFRSGGQNLMLDLKLTGEGELVGYFDLALDIPA